MDPKTFVPAESGNASKSWRVKVVKFLFMYLIVYPVTLLRNFFVNYTSKQQARRTEKRYLNILASTEEQTTWNSTAENLDKLRGVEDWKVQNIKATYCNGSNIVHEANAALRLRQLDCCKASGTFLRTMLHRRANGMASPMFFRFYTQTKAFLEDYNDIVCDLVHCFGGSMKPENCKSFVRHVHDIKPVSSEYVQSMVDYAEAHKGENDLSVEERLQVLQETIRAYGRSALMLSGGASLGMYHTGVIRALFNANLLPQIISGSSAGSIIASIMCTRTDEELQELLCGTLSINLSLNAFEDHEDVAVGVGMKINRLVSTGAFMDVKTLMECLRLNCGDLTFLEAYKKSGRILNISVANDREGAHIDKHMLLNYVTTPNVVVWSAVSASCAMPGLFSAVQLLEKAIDGSMVPYLPGQLWFDGSVTRDLPKEELATIFDVNYFIVSQVNPQVIPFLQKPPSPLVHKRKTPLIKRMWFSFWVEYNYWARKLYRFGLLPRTGAAEILYLLLTQSWSGDLTLLPIGSVWAAIPDFLNLTTNPTMEHLEYVTSNAQRRTWPHLNQIKMVTQVERAILKEIAFLREIAMKPSDGELVK
jgi:predicted acylesterase/phospholipase RssA